MARQAVQIAGLKAALYRLQAVATGLPLPMVEFGAEIAEEAAIVAEVEDALTQRNQRIGHLESRTPDAHVTVTVRAHSPHGRSPNSKRQEETKTVTVPFSKGGGLACQSDLACQSTTCQSTAASSRALLLSGTDHELLHDHRGSCSSVPSSSSVCTAAILERVAERAAELEKRAARGEREDSDLGEPSTPSRRRDTAGSLGTTANSVSTPLANTPVASTPVANTPVAQAPASPRSTDLAKRFQAAGSRVEARRKRFISLCQSADMSATDNSGLTSPSPKQGFGLLRSLPEATPGARARSTSCRKRSPRRVYGSPETSRRSLVVPCQPPVRGPTARGNPSCWDASKPSQRM